MNCIKCGAKIKNRDKYCSNCGTKVIRVSFKELFYSRRGLLKRTSIFLILIVLYLVVNALYFSEDAVIRRYLVAYANNDYNTIIKLSNISKNEFMSEDVINNKYGNPDINKVDVRILSTSNKSGEHNRTASYTVNESTKVVNLSIKKDLFGNIIYPKYLITNNDLIAKNIKITIPKYTTLVLDNILVDDKYKVSETDSIITYKIDSVLKKNVLIKLKIDDVELTDCRSLFNNENIYYTNLVFTDVDSKSSKVIKENINKKINDTVMKKVTVDSFDLISAKLDEESIDTRINVYYSYNDSNNVKHSKNKIIRIIFDKKLNITDFYLNNISIMF